MRSAEHLATVRQHRVDCLGMADQLLVAQLGQAARPATSRSDASIRAETTKKIKTLGQTGKAREAVSALAQMARLGRSLLSSAEWHHGCSD